jgi:hypothetical protein
MKSRLVLIPLFKDLRIVTDPNAAVTSYIELDTPSFTHLLPHAEALALHSLTVGAPTGDDLEWNVVLVPGFDRSHEIAEIKLGPSANITANGAARHPPYSTINDFLLEGRLRLLYKNAAGVTTAQSASVSAVLAVLTVGS